MREILAIQVLTGPPTYSRPTRSVLLSWRIETQREVGGVIAGDRTDDGRAVLVVLRVVRGIDVDVHWTTRVQAHELDMALDPMRADTTTAARERSAEPRVVRAVG